jgi:hypothetical protein
VNSHQLSVNYKIFPALSSPAPKGPAKADTFGIDGIFDGMYQNSGLKT